MLKFFNYSTDSFRDALIIYKKLFSGLILVSFAYSQSIPQYFFSNQYQKHSYDLGFGWNRLSNFSTIRFEKSFQNYHLKKKHLSFNSLIGNDTFSYSAYGRYSFKEKYFFYYSLWNTPIKETNITTNINNQYQRNSFRSSGIGYYNKWITLEICRGNENWSSGNDIQLALSEKSNFYDYFLLGSDYGKIRVRYIHGLLEITPDTIKRFIAAKGLEWTNKKSLIIGLSEIVIYSGENRNFEIAYLNPISTHLEIELNERSTVLDYHHANAVWQLHLDYLLMGTTRFSINYLFDEIVFDPLVEKGKQNGLAYSIRISRAFFTKKLKYSSYISLIKIGTPTFRHNNGLINFTKGDRPLGWQNGSDLNEIHFGTNFIFKGNFILKLDFGFLEVGEESVTQHFLQPYKDYFSGPFPSGEVQTYKTGRCELFWENSKKISTFINFQTKKNNSGEYYHTLNFGASLFLI